MPGYGIAGPDEGRGLLPWTWAEERLVSSHDYWLATVHPNGAPACHARVGGVGGRCRLVQLQSPVAQDEKHRGRATGGDHDGQPPAARGGGRSGASACVDDHDDRAGSRRGSTPSTTTDIAVAFFTENACFRLEPRRVFSLDESDFTGSPTRWGFGE